MEKLTLNRARELLKTTTTQPNLFSHAQAVASCMASLAAHFDQDALYWQAVGYLHDYDYELFPEEHLQHTETKLQEAGVDPESIRAILAHGWGLCTDIEPLTLMEKALFAVDELSGLIGATAKMRPNGMSDLEAASVLKKFKDKNFAAGCNRQVILQGADLLGLSLKDEITLCIAGMKNLLS